MSVFANVNEHIRLFLLLLLTINTTVNSNAHLHSLTMVLSICNFTNTITPANLTKLLNSNDNHVNLPDMIDVCSHGQQSYDTTIVPYVLFIPCGMQRINQSQMNCNYWEWSDIALNILKQRSPTLYIQQYDHTIYILPNVDTCNFAGMGVIGPCFGNKCRIWIHGMYANQLAPYMHEIGHTLGLYHTHYNGSEYGDLSSAMGACCHQRCYNAGNTDFLQWTHPKQSLTILPLRYFSKNILLTPNEYIIVDTPYDARYFIQYRYPISLKYDNEITDTFSKCINVYHTTFEHPEETTLLNILCNVSNIWTNSKQHFTIIVKNKTTSSVTLSIQSIVKDDIQKQTCPSTM